MKLMLASCALFAFVGLGDGKPKSGGKPENPPASGKLPPELDAEDVADIPSQDLRLDGDEKRRYLLAGPRPDEKAPKSGFGLIVVMPGGTGDATFHPFVKRIYKNAVPDGFLVVQPVAPKWTEKQFVVWPTNKVKADGMKFSCDDFVEDVVAAIAKTQKIDPERVYTLSWSSSGPLAYLLSMRKGGAVRGSFIAMSVFHENEYDVELAKGQRYYLYHSAEDETCPFAQAEEARDLLKKKGATVEFAKYTGGHGWRGNVFGDIRKGFDWLLTAKK